MTTQKIHSENGYATLAAVIVLIIGSLGLIERFGSLRALYAQQRWSDLKAESENLSTAVRMLYGKRVFCVQELNKGVFGTRVTELKDTHPFLSTGSAFGASPSETPQRLKVLGSSFSEPVQVFDDGKSFALELRLTTSLEAAGQNQAPLQRVITIPFYFVTDGSTGTLSECMATSYASPEQRTTLEDKACSLLIGSGYRYQPSLRRCSNTGVSQ